ncbi:Holliday junction resolvase RuvX [Timonella sp. A28]|uniref:Holliday junction resolvase RuvX n=1 Tax=Timonella sp. A28 TaxID=3442640 RepID=UPI003EBCDB1D
MAFYNGESVEPQPIARGARLAVDVGTVRVGVAASDPDGILASPVATLQRDRSVTYTIGGKIPAALPSDITAIRELVEERWIKVIYIGLPKHLSGNQGSSAQMALTYADLIKRVVPEVEVRLIDERMTTVTAHQALHSSGKNSKKHRSVVDQVAAVVMLETALETEKRTGERAGSPVEA